jgi:hypothetical protein
MERLEASEIYIDESGSSGSDLWNTDQPNLLLAAVAIPLSRESAFWRQASAAWMLAADLLCQPADSIELKASDLFGGRGLFRESDGGKRREILSTIFEALVQHDGIVFWDGFSKASLAHTLREAETWFSSKQLSDRVVKVFAENLHRAIERLRPDGLMFVMADELPTRRSGKALQCDSWNYFEDNAVQFGKSSEAHGLQVADIVVHTLSRANRVSLTASTPSKLSNTDQLAVTFRERLASADRWVSLSQGVLAE